MRASWPTPLICPGRNRGVAIARKQTRMERDGGQRYDGLDDGLHVRELALGLVEEISV